MAPASTERSRPSIEVGDDREKEGTKALHVATRNPRRSGTGERADDRIGACALLSTGCQQRGAVERSVDERGSPLSVGIRNSPQESIASRRFADASKSCTHHQASLVQESERFY